MCERIDVDEVLDFAEKLETPEPVQVKPSLKWRPTDGGYPELVSAIQTAFNEEEDTASQIANACVVMVVMGVLGGTVLAPKGAYTIDLVFLPGLQGFLKKVEGFETYFLIEYLKYN